MACPPPSKRARSSSNITALRSHSRNRGQDHSKTSQPKCDGAEKRDILQTNPLPNVEAESRPLTPPVSNSDREACAGPQLQSPLSCESRAVLHPPCPPCETSIGPPGLNERLYRVVNVVPKGETGEDDLRSDLSLSIYERYSMALHIEDGRYCFYEPEEDTSPKEKEHFRLDILDIIYEITAGSYLARLRVSEYENAWMTLSKKGKADLCRVMNTPMHLWHGLKYFREERRWIKRGYDGDTNCMLLTHYGRRPDARGYTSFTEILSADLKPEELAPDKHSELVELWNSALKSGMGNGEGCTAVFELFKELIRLLPEMDILSPVRIYHKTYTSRLKGYYVSDTSSSLSTPVKKKLLKPSAPSKGEGDAPKCDDVTPHRQLPDMVVLNRDDKSGCAKYLALIGIHSKGEEDPKAQQKFLREVLCALQAQDAVFGYLFSVSDVMHYYAKREVTGNINVEQFRYPIAWPIPDEPHCRIHVGAFQMLIMDLLSALIFGIHKFNV